MFDTNNDGFTQVDSLSTDGWALAFTQDHHELGLFNATTLNIDGYELFSSEQPLSIYLVFEDDGLWH